VILLLTESMDDVEPVLTVSLQRKLYVSYHPPP
jgi:hypothetical protein